MMPFEVSLFGVNEFVKFDEKSPITNTNLLLLLVKFTFHLSAHLHLSVFSFLLFNYSSFIITYTSFYTTHIQDI